VLIVGATLESRARQTLASWMAVLALKRFRFCSMLGMPQPLLLLIRCDALDFEDLWH
jgi:hypothetical protein